MINKNFLSQIFSRPPPTSQEQTDSSSESPKMNLDRQLVVVDIGCRWGFAEKFISKERIFHVYGFDPDREECQRLEKRYEGESVSIVPLGLAGTSGKRTLHITQEPACSSLLPPDKSLTENYPALWCARQVSTLEVETTTLDEWATSAAVPLVDYIKLDTQGTELEILKGGIQVLKSVRCIEVEVEFNPIYIGQPVFSDVDLFLRSQGFVLWKLTNQVHYSSAGAPDAPIGKDAIYYDEKHQIDHPLYGGQLYWANAHYIKKDVLLGHRETESHKTRDVTLFQSLGMPDVVSHLRTQNP